MRSKVTLGLVASLALAGVAVLCADVEPAANLARPAPPRRTPPAAQTRRRPVKTLLAPAGALAKGTTDTPSSRPAPRPSSPAEEAGPPPGRAEALGRAALEGSPEARDEAFERLCALSLERPDLAPGLRQALFRVADSGSWPAAALRFLPMAGASRAEIGRLGVSLSSVDPEVRRAAVGALGRADPRGPALLELEVAFSRETDPALLEAIAAAALRVAREEAAELLERLLTTRQGSSELREVLLTWREGLRSGELAASEIFAAGSGVED